MSEVRFCPSLTISVYLAAIQYLALLPLLFVFFAIFSLNQSIAYSLLVSISIYSIIVYTVATEFHSERIVISSCHGLESYSFGQFARSNHFLYWDEIYSVESYRYFGLHFLLIRHHSSDSPVWFPLFLKNQTKLNLSVLENTSQDNLLHTALLENNNKCQQVPWHSRVKKHKSDLYIQKLNSTLRIYFSFKKSFLFFLSLEIILIIVLLFIFWLCFDSVYQVTELSIILMFQTLVFILIWQLILKNSYIAVNNNSFELNIGFFLSLTKHNIYWSEIKKVKYSNLIILKQFCIFSQNCLYGQPYTPINISLLDTAKFKKAIIDHTKPQNPLYQAVVKYL